MLVMKLIKVYIFWFADGVQLDNGVHPLGMA